jgi:hypothetical protein
MAEQREKFGLNRGGRPKTGLVQNPVSIPTLAEAGINKSLAQRARKAAAMTDGKFDNLVESTRETIERGVEKERRRGNKRAKGGRKKAQLHNSDPSEKPNSNAPDKEAICTSPSQPAPDLDAAQADGRHAHEVMPGVNAELETPANLAQR